MTAPPRVTFGTFALQASGLTVLLAVIGWWLAHAYYAHNGPPAVIAGLGMSLMAALISGWFLAYRAGRRTGPEVERPAVARPAVAQPTALLDSLGAMGVRLLVLTALVAAAVISEQFLNTPLLLSVAVGYVVLLGVETRFSLALAAREAEAGRPTSSAEDRDDLQGDGKETVSDA